MKYSDITSSAQRRAQKVTNARGLYFLNELVKVDIYAPTVVTFKDYFEGDETVTMIDGTTTYALSTDVFAIREIQDQDGNLILRGTNTPRDVEPKNRVKVYGGNLIVDADRNFTILYVFYYKPIPDFDESSDIDLPDDITAALKNVWVTGLERFYFNENKKAQSATVSDANYTDAKDRIFTYRIGSLV